MKTTRPRRGITLSVPPGRATSRNGSLPGHRRRQPCCLLAVARMGRSDPDTRQRRSGIESSTASFAQEWFVAAKSSAAGLGALG